MKKYILLTALLINTLLVTISMPQIKPDPNFYIFLCFGQSNMEGQGIIEEQDKTVDPRFQVMETINCTNLGRTKGSWYTATPPLCRCYTGLSPADYFGRTMVENLPDSIRVGIINVSVAGCKIELFDKDNYQDYVATAPSWMMNIINEYDGNPYAHLVETAQAAQEDGIIKGILLHQGESNTNDNQWTSKVKGVYDNLLNDLNLEPDSVPLLAGEVVHADQNGICASMNSIIGQLPQAVPNSYVISSSGCTDAEDNLHFNSAGYRELGKRYAEKMLSLLGYEPSEEVSQKWVGTWTTSPQLVEPNNNPPSPGLSNNTIRQIVHVSIGGDSLRVKFSNEFSSNPVTMNEVHIALSKEGSEIDTATDKILYFNGLKNITMTPGSAVTSDPLQFSLEPLSNIAITIYFGETSSDVTGHPGSRTTSYILTGNEVSKKDFNGSVQTDHWYVINTIDVKAADTSYAVAILGNSITDGRGSGTNKQNRWPDELSRRFQENPGTKHIGVLNAGIGGNAVLRGGLGPTALNRFQRDIIGQSGIKWLIIFEGINDIGGSFGTGVAQELINAYEQMIDIAHANGIFVYGATFLPFGGSNYYSTDHETSRRTVNEWIRNSGRFDAVIDLDKALRNPADTLKLLPEADDGDHLHPSETGHRMIAEAVDLNLFTGNDSLIHNDSSLSFYHEPECGVVGENWEFTNDVQASNGKYVAVKPGIQSINAAPSDSAGIIYIPFSVDTNGNFNIYARLNCATYDDDSYWMKVDDEEFMMYNGLVTSGWQWMNLTSYQLAKGEHTLAIAYREDGAKLDKICISNSSTPPSGMGEEAENICQPTGLLNLFRKDLPAGYTLEQNFPNPFNPATKIKFTIPEEGYFTLKVFNTLGEEVAELLNEKLETGFYDIDFDASQLASGLYIYSINGNNINLSKKMILLR